MFRRLSRAVTLLALVVAGCGAPPASTVDAGDDDFDRQFGIAPAGLVEVNVNMDVGDTMTATYETDAGSLRWDVHSHPSEIEIHDEGVAASGEITFTAPEYAQFSILWENRSEGPIVLSVTVDVTGTAEIAGWVTEP
jgi:hypothetical protein